MNRSTPFDRRDLGLAALLFAAVLAVGLPGVDRYGLTWDEPTYSRFARLQRQWLSEAVTFPFTDARVAEVFSRERVAEVWLQDAVENGHPPLNETWQALVSAPFTWMGQHDTSAFRSAIVVLFGLTISCAYALLRGDLSRLASVTGASSLLGVPVVWAHAHLGATETMQIFFWVLLAAVFPKVMGWPPGRADSETAQTAAENSDAREAVGSGRVRGGWMVVWFAACALAFAGKFTNYLAPLWVLGTAGVLGAWRRPRYWIAVLVGAVLAPLALVIVDPYFWPWQGGWARFLDYLGQVGSRADWIPINVFYMGKGWGFDPPWHYRIVETAAALPLVLFPLLLTGLAHAASQTWRQVIGQRVTCWSAALLVSVLGLTWVVGELPGTPNHDATRQFVFVFVGVPLAAGLAFDVLRSLASSGRRKAAPLSWRRLATAVPMVLVAVAVVTSLRAEPWGLSYRSEWLGGTKGAWDRGFEVSYWGEAIDGALLDEVAALRDDGQAPYVLSTPKLNYFFEAKDLWAPLISAELRERLRDPDFGSGTGAAFAYRPLAVDAVPVFYDGWVPDEAREALGPILRLTFRRPLDGVLFFHRRGAVAGGLVEVLDRLVAEGDLAVEAETRVDGVTMARLYKVVGQEAVTLPFDDSNSTWFQPSWVAEQLRLALDRGRSGDPGAAGR